MCVKCCICNLSFKSNVSLSHHIKSHNMYIKDYYDTYIKKENEGICPVCKKETNFKGLNAGYQICCSPQCANKYSVSKIKQVKLERYGDANYNNVSKAQETCLKKYGCKNPQQNKQIKDKSKQTCIERYGADNPMKNKNIYNKMQQTNLKRYGAKNVYASKYGKDKIKETNLKRYGVEYTSQCKEILHKTQQTNLERYNAICNLNTPDVKAKVQSFDAIKKRLNTRKHKDYFRYSSYEIMFKKGLEKLGLIEDIDFYTQYYSKEYKHACDFYLVKSKTFIEINGHWKHGPHPYTGSKDDLEIISIWTEKAKLNDSYKSAISTWTESDVNKRKEAKQNNLNFVELYTKEDIQNYLKMLEEGK